jgi:hypothetical protein
LLRGIEKIVGNLGCFTRTLIAGSLALALAEKFREIASCCPLPGLRVTHLSSQPVTPQENNFTR